MQRPGTNEHAHAVARRVMLTKVMRLWIVLLAFGCGKSDSKSPTPSKQPAKPSTKSKMRFFADDEAKPMCEKLIAPALREGYTVGGGGQIGEGMIPGHVLCRLKKPGSNALFDIAVAVKCGETYTIDDFKKNAAPYKYQNGSSGWKPATGPGKEARLLDPGFESQQIEFWSDKLSCSVGASVNRDETGIDLVAWATKLEASLTERPPL